MANEIAFKHDMSQLYPQSENLPGAPVQQSGAGYGAGGVATISGTGAGSPTAPPPQFQQQYLAPPPSYGPYPVRLTCPSCHETNVSNVKFENSTKTHLLALLLLVTTCCCCIPYCINSCKNANHHCSHCGAYLGTYSN